MPVAAKNWLHAFLPRIILSNHGGYCIIGGKAGRFAAGEANNHAGRKQKQLAAIGNQH